MAINTRLIFQVIFSVFLIFFESSLQAMETELAGIDIGFNKKAETLSPAIIKQIYRLDLLLDKLKDPKISKKEAEEVTGQIEKIPLDVFYTRFKDMRDHRIVSEFQNIDAPRLRMAIYDYYKKYDPSFIDEVIYPLMRSSKIMDAERIADLHFKLVELYENGSQEVEKDLEHALKLGKVLVDRPYFYETSNSQVQFFYRKESVEKLESLLLGKLNNFVNQSNEKLIEAYNNLKIIDEDLVYKISSLARMHLGKIFMIDAKNPKDFIEAKLLFESINPDEQSSRLAKFYLALFYDNPTAEKDAIFDKERQELFEVYFKKHGEKDLSKAMQLYNAVLEFANFKNMEDQSLLEYARRRIQDLLFEILAEK